MRRFAVLVCILTLGAACVVESKPIDPSNDGGIDSGVLCGAIRCPEDRPLCSDALECVQCIIDDDSYCTDQGLLCDLDSSMCVGCTGDSDCTDPAAARCDNDVCTTCTEASQCDGVDGLDPMGNVCEDGLCVDCTPETEGDSCMGNRSCNPATNECTDVFVGSLDVCEPCVADSQCGEDGEASDAFRCVPMFYEMPDARFPDDETGFCLKSTEGGCEQPFSITLSMRPSLSDAPSDDYCGINEELATCPAVKALVDNETCEGGTPEECPQPSGLCTKVGDLENRCTYLCSDPVECKDPPVPGSTCGSSGPDGDDYCGG